MRKADLERTEPLPIPQSKKRKFKKYLLRLLIILFLFLFITAALGFFYLKNFESRINKNQSAHKFLSPVTNEKELNLLMVGMDKWSVKEKGRSDTIILLFLRPREKKAVLVSIPRDTRVRVPGYGKTKINHSFAYGGTPLLIQTVREFLDVQIHHYLLTDLEGFKEIVDTLGGVDIYVEKKLYDPEHHILIKPGWRHLNGKEALNYVRFRHDPQGDFGRIKRQQKFFQAVLDKVTSSNSIWKIPSLINSIAKCVETDMSISEMVSLARVYRSVRKEDIQMTMLPGYPARLGGVSYVLPEEKKIKEIMYWLKSRGELPKVLEQDLKDISIVVLNGCGKEGWARQVSSHIKSVLDVKRASIGDAENKDFLGTVIQFKPGKKEAASALKEWLGFGYLEEKEGLNADLVIILGKDSISKLEGRIS